jgi:hypothetical protein
LSDQITVARSQAFSARVAFLLQQMTARLRVACLEGTHVGKQAVALEQVGVVAAQKKISRNAEIQTISTPIARRWVVPQDYAFRDFLDTTDMIRMLWDEKPQMATTFAMALKRAVDDQIIGGFFAASLVGETASATEAFDTTNFQVAVDAGNTGTNTGLTVYKLRQARRKLRAAEVPEDEEYFVAVSAAQEDNLLAETQAINLDYTTQPVLEEGHIKKFMGFNFIHSERLGVDANSFRQVPAWVKSGMYYGSWMEPQTPVDWDFQRQAWQIAGIGTFGATRLEQGRVIQILCAES